jgi:hypothetical protein
MGKSIPDPPPPPDPYATARAQTGSNVSTSIANTVSGNANVKGPLGSTTFNQIGSHTIREPTLDKDGKQVMTRKWVADPNATPQLQYRTWQEGTPARGGSSDTDGGSMGTLGQWIDSRTNQPWDDQQGGRWVEEGAYTEYEVPRWEQVNTLSPEQQKLLSQQQALGTFLNDLAGANLTRLDETLKKPLNTASLPAGAAELLRQNGGVIERANFTGGANPTANFTGGANPTASFLGGPIPTGEILSRPIPRADFSGNLPTASFAGETPTADFMSGSVPDRQNLQKNILLQVLQGTVPETQRTIDYGDVVRYDDVGGPARSTGYFGFEMERSRVEDAIRARQRPELDRQRDALQTQLINQGFVRGTEAFNAQMDEQIRRENDAETAAILAGGQEQTRMGQLALGRFGAENAAQAQADEQARARGLFGLGISQFRNDAQRQEYGQLFDRAKFGNDAIGRDNEFVLAKMAAENAAREAQFGIDLSGAQLRDSRIGSQFQADMAGAQLRDSRIGNQFSADMAGQQLRDSRISSQFQSDLAGEQLYNDRVRSQFEMDMAGAQLRDSRIGSQFQADMAGAQLRDSRIGNQFSADMAGAQLTDARTARQFEADQGRLAAQQSLRQQALQEELALRAQPINEIAALMSGGQVTMPQFGAFRASPMSETPVGDYVYRSADIERANLQAQANMQAQANAGMFGMGAQLLGGMFKMSDKRVKTDIAKVGALDNGLPIYVFRYKAGGPMQVGLMAQDVEAIDPLAVMEFDGVKHVDYARAVQ